MLDINVVEAKGRLRIATPYTPILKANEDLISRVLGRETPHRTIIPDFAEIEGLLSCSKSMGAGDLSRLASDYIRAHEGKEVLEFDSNGLKEMFLLKQDIEGFLAREAELQAVFKLLAERQLAMLKSGSIDDRNSFLVKRELDVLSGVDDNNLRKFILPHFVVRYKGNSWFAKDLVCANDRDQLRKHIRPLVECSRREIRLALNARGIKAADGTIKTVVHQVKLESRALALNMSPQEFRHESGKVGLKIYGLTSVHTILNSLKHRQAIPGRLKSCA